MRAENGEANVEKFKVHSNEGPEGNHEYSGSLAVVQDLPNSTQTHSL
jgi:hypothetical protein